MKEKNHILPLNGKLYTYYRNQSPSDFIPESHKIFHTTGLSILFKSFSLNVSSIQFILITNSIFLSYFNCNGFHTQN